MAFIRIEKTNAIGLYVQAGKYGGTYAHKDIAFEFGSAISPVFKLYLLKEYQLLKKLEHDQQKLAWDVKRFLSKVNYLIHTDAVKKYILPQSDYVKQTEGLAYADEADLLNEDIRFFAVLLSDLLKAAVSCRKLNVETRTYV